MGHSILKRNRSKKDRHQFSEKLRLFIITHTWRVLSQYDDHTGSFCDLTQPNRIIIASFAPFFILFRDGEAASGVQRNQPSERWNFPRWFGFGSKTWLLLYRNCYGCVLHVVMKTCSCPSEVAVCFDFSTNTLDFSRRRFMFIFWNWWFWEIWKWIGRYFENDSITLYRIVSHWLFAIVLYFWYFFLNYSWSYMRIHMFD